MQLGPGEYFGRPVWERRSGGLLLTLSAYRPGPTQPWHCHANPTLFLLLAGDHRDLSRQGGFDQPPFSLVYHPTTHTHAAEHGSRGMRGLNIEYGPDWLGRNELSAPDLGGYQPLDSARARLAAQRFLVTAFQPDERSEADLETQALELLEPLVARPGQPAPGPAPRWLGRAEEFLGTRFRESVGLRHVAAEAGVHPVYLARVFRRRHGCSVSEHLRTLRLVEAGRLVLQGASLAQAAHAAGFADQAHFSRRFAAAFGLTPKGLWLARVSLHGQA
jgi:AraC family transcriptional regulator